MIPARPPPFTVRRGRMLARRNALRPLTGAGDWGLPAVVVRAVS